MKNIVKMQAREVMKDCVRRLRLIVSELSVDSFINLIYDPDNPEAPTNSKIPRDPTLPRTFGAFVNSEQQGNYKINIGINFTGRVKKRSGIRICSTVMGMGSRVSTLCHEMSHFEKKFADSSLGGMGTFDYDVDGRKPLPGEKDNWSYEQHLAGADKLVKTKDENVFDNSYNIERYFEIIV